ncbi:hypothetical protein M5X11_39445 [Paenibacillus alginolyticus]|uniref:hypothetical protein n=1 Tax=Paenibacillus alginolyticus TaxID=59839 RepID=UPI00040D840C|nr:hypothetical protein [Paenibacillus alginolyticus]MCY9670893.1 hypothetical protein [Paenibacillus alginolyticus]
MEEFLYHYYDESTGPFRNLSDLEADEAERVLNNIHLQKKGFASEGACHRGSSFFCSFK